MLLERDRTAAFVVKFQKLRHHAALRRGSWNPSRFARHCMRQAANIIT